MQSLGECGLPLTRTPPRAAPVWVLPERGPTLHKRVARDKPSSKRVYRESMQREQTRLNINMKAHARTHKRKCKSNSHGPPVGKRGRPAQSGRAEDMALGPLRGPWPVWSITWPSARTRPTARYMALGPWRKTARLVSKRRGPTCQPRSGQMPSDPVPAGAATTCCGRYAGKCNEARADTTQCTSRWAPSGEADSGATTTSRALGLVH